MNKFNITIVLLLICFGLVFLDLKLNNYAAILFTPFEQDNLQEKQPEEKTIPSKGTAEETSATFTDDLLKKANVQKIFLDDLEIVSNFFNLVDIGDLPYTVIKQTLMTEEDQKRVGRLYEIKADRFNSNNLYFKIKKLADSSGVTNETNQYGERSFYVNIKDEKYDIARLIVKQGDMIYGFEYPRKNHEVMKRIITAL